MKLTFFISLLIISTTGFAEAGNNQNLITLNKMQRESYAISVAKLKPATEVLGASYPAQVVVPNSQLQVISARQGGLVETMIVAEGDTVTTGQMLAKIQSPALLELQRDLLQTLSQLNLAQSTLNRDKQLQEEGIIPKRRYQESLSALQALQTQKEQEEGALQFSGMSNEEITELEKTRKLNSILKITAPFTGVLLEQMAIPGQKLEAADPLFKLAKLSPLWLEIHVPVNVVNNVSMGDTISIPDMNITGEVITIGHKVHAADQGTLIRAIVKENIEQLRPGQFVQARLSQRSVAELSYLVPGKAIIRFDGKTMIFIETVNGFKAIDVEVIGSHEGQQIISTEQAITDPVVVTGTVSLKAILTGAGGEG